MAAFTVRLDDEQHRQLKVAAAYLEVRLADVVREGVSDWLAATRRTFPDLEAVIGSGGQSAS